MPGPRDRNYIVGKSVGGVNDWIARYVRVPFAGGTALRSFGWCFGIFLVLRDSASYRITGVGGEIIAISRRLAALRVRLVPLWRRGAALRIGRRDCGGYDLRVVCQRVTEIAVQRCLGHIM